MENEEPETIVLKNKTIAGLPASFIADQVSGRKKAKEKIPLYRDSAGIIFPPKINLEQSSSQTTALYKIDEIKRSGLRHFNSCVDLTGGFGIDSYFLSTVFNSLIYVEPNTELLEIAANNHKQLGASNIQHINSNASGFLESTHHTFDLIYIDPSRRITGNMKVASFTQSEPNVVEMLDVVLDKANTLLIKASPLLDIQLALKELKTVTRVAVNAVDNDCKELLFFVRKDGTGEPLIHTVNIRTSSTQLFDFFLSKEQESEPTYSEPQEYLYEANAAIMKAGAFKSVANNFALAKIHKNTHLYTSSGRVSNFPGRTFKVIAHVKPDPFELKKYFPHGKANIMTRNYPLSVDELRKKTRLTDGGELYLIGFSGANKKILVAAERVK